MPFSIILQRKVLESTIDPNGFMVDETFGHAIQDVFLTIRNGKVLHLNMGSYKIPS